MKPPSNKRRTRMTKNLINAATFNQINTVCIVCCDVLSPCQSQTFATFSDATVNKIRGDQLPQQLVLQNSLCQAFSGSKTKHYSTS